MWPLLILGKLLSFLGLILLLFALIPLFFPAVKRTPEYTPRTKGSVRLWALLSAPLIMGALFIPIYTMGKRALNPSFIFPQTDCNGLAILAVIGVCVYWALGKLLNRRDPHAPSVNALLALEFRTIGKTMLKAVAIVSILYGFDLLFH